MRIDAAFPARPSPTSTQSGRAGFADPIQVFQAEAEGLSGVALWQARQGRYGLGRQPLASALNNPALMGPSPAPPTGVSEITPSAAAPTSVPSIAFGSWIRPPYAWT